MVIGLFNDVEKSISIPKYLEGQAGPLYSAPDLGTGKTALKSSYIIYVGHIHSLY